MKAGLPKGEKAGDFAKFARNVADNPYAMGAIGGVAGHLATKDDEKNVAEAEDEMMSAEEFFGEGDCSGDHGALTEVGDSEDSEMISAEEFFAEGLGKDAIRAGGAMAGAGLGAAYANEINSVLPDGTPGWVAPVAGAGLGYGAARLATPDNDDNVDANESENGEMIDEMVSAEEFFSEDDMLDNRPHNGHIAEGRIPDDDFFVPAAAMK